MSNLAGLSYNIPSVTLHPLAKFDKKSLPSSRQKKLFLVWRLTPSWIIKIQIFRFWKTFLKKRPYASAQQLSTKSDNCSLIYSDITTFKEQTSVRGLSNSTDGLTAGRTDTNTYCDHLADDHGIICISDCDTHNVYLSSCLLSGTLRLPDFVKIRWFSVLFVIWWNWIHGRDNIRTERSHVSYPSHPGYSFTKSTLHSTAQVH